MLRPGMPQRDQPGLCELLDEIAERADAVVALGEGRIELQQRALQEAKLRRHLTVRQHLQRALDERNRLADIGRSGCCTILAPTALEQCRGVCTRFS